MAGLRDRIRLVGECIYAAIAHNTLKLIVFVCIFLFELF
jgi:hypothetical protein